jgi:nucleoside 2-deoxyribosyltransferase
MYTLFLSHSATDLDLVGEIRRRSTFAGIRVYAYEDDVQAGRNLAEKLLDAVRDADGLVAVLTRRAVKRPAIQQEVGAALALNKPVFALIEPGVDMGAMALLQGVEYVTLDPNDPRSALERLQRSIQKHQQRNAMGMALAILVVVCICVVAMRTK